MVPDEKPQGGEVSFGGSVVDRQGACFRGHGGIPTTMMQQPVHQLRVAKAGSQVQDCGTRIVFVLWEKCPLVLAFPQPRRPFCPWAPNWPSLNHTCATCAGLPEACWP